MEQVLVNGAVLSANYALIALGINRAKNYKS